MHWRCSDYPFIVLTPCAQGCTTGYGARVERPKRQIITRSVVAEVLGVSITHVRTLERLGRLTPKLQDGQWIFDAQQVAAVGAQRTARRTRRQRRVDEGRAAARALELRKQGRDYRALIAELELPADEARRIWESVATPGELVLTPEQVDALRAAGILGEDASGTALVAGVMRLRERVRALRRREAVNG
jgi:hypothetical protein